MEKTSFSMPLPPKVHTHTITSSPIIEDGNCWRGYQFTIQDGYDIDCGCGNGYERETWRIYPDGTCSYGHFVDGEMKIVKGTFDATLYEMIVVQMIDLKTDWKNELNFEGAIRLW